MADSLHPSLLRQSLPGLLPWQVAMLAAVAGIFTVHDLVPAVAALALLVGLTLWRDPRTPIWRPLALLPLWFLLGWGYAGLRLPASPEEIPEVILRREGAVVMATVEEVRTRPDQELQCILGQVRAASQGVETPLPGGLAWTWKYPAVRPVPGQAVAVALGVLPQRGFLNPGNWDTRFHWARQGVFWRAYSFGPERTNAMFGPVPGESPTARLWLLREGVRQTLLEATPPGQGQAMLLALLLGDRFLLSNTTNKDMRQATLAHSLALSGMNLAMAAALGYGLAWLLGRLWPRLLLRLPRPKLAVLCGAPLVLVYYWLGGGGPSLDRALIMFAVWAVFLWRDRGAWLLDGLAVALAIILLVSPLSAFDLSLQMSVLAVIGLGLFWPVWQRAAVGLLRPVSGHAALWSVAYWTLGMLGASLAANLALYPVLLANFGQLPLGLWWNLLWLPLQGWLVMPLGFAGLGLALVPGLEVVGRVLLGWDAAVIEGFLHLLAWGNGHGLSPVAMALRPSWPATTGFYLFCLWAVLPRQAERGWGQWACLALALGLLCHPMATTILDGWRGEVRLTVLDVGQSQALVIETPSGARVLVDGGGTASRTFDLGEAVTGAALAWERRPELAGMVMTHAEQDHAQGLLFPLRHFHVGWFAANGRWPETELAEELREALEERRVAERVVQVGQRLDLGDDVALEVLHPSADSQDKKTNNLCLALRLVWQGRGLALLPGDLERAGQAAMLRANDDVGADVLVLPHHGSATGAWAELYARVRPGAVVGSCGYLNRFDFPHMETLELVRQSGAALFTTADNGQLTVSWRAPAAPARVVTFQGGPYVWPPALGESSP